jgi:hypothetical protein
MGWQRIGMRTIFPADFAEGRRGLGALVDFEGGRKGDFITVPLMGRQRIGVDIIFLDSCIVYTKDLR